MPSVDTDLVARDGTGEMPFSLIEQALLYHSAARSLHRPKDAAVDALGYVNLAQGVLPGDDGNPQVLTPAASARAPFKDLNGPDGTIVFRRGRDAAGAAATTRSTLRGTSFYLPTGSWYVGIIGKLSLPAAQGHYWATDDLAAANGIGAGTTSNGTMRFYSQMYGTQVFVASAAGVNDGGDHLWEWIYDGAQVVASRDRTAYLTSTAALPPMTGVQRNLRIGSARATVNDDTAPSIQSAGDDYAYLTAQSVDAAYLAAVKALALSLRPALTIA